MKNLFKLYMMLPGLLFAASCSDDWTPGPEAEDTMGVYFEVQPSYSYMVQPDDNHLLAIPVGRLDGTQAATIPLKTISCPEGVVVPSNVTFAAGSTQALVTIDVTGMAVKTSGKVELSIDPAYTNIYAAGTSSLTLDIQMTGAWLPVADKVEVSYEDDAYRNVYPVQTSQIFWLDGTDQFKLENFCYSGLDLYFRVKDQNEHQTKGYSEVIPYKNAISYAEVFDEDDEYDMWVLYDTDKEELPSWTPPGAPASVDFIAFYSGVDYAYISFTNGYGGFLGDAEYTDGTWAFLYISLTFKPNFNPFDQIGAE